MALPQRNDGPVTTASSVSAPSVDHRYNAGGPIGEIHADLTSRLARQGFTLDPLELTGVERLVRIVSRTAGLVALAAGYVGVTLLLLR